MRMTQVFEKIGTNEGEQNLRRTTGRGRGVGYKNSTAILSFRDPDRTGPLCLLAVLCAWLNDIRGNHMAKKRKAKKTKRKQTAKRRKRSTRILGVPIPTLGRG